MQQPLPVKDAMLVLIPRARSRFLLRRVLTTW
jgi:hypothetical protein